MAREMGCSYEGRWRFVRVLKGKISRRRRWQLGSYLKRMTYLRTLKCVRYWFLRMEKVEWRKSYSDLQLFFFSVSWDPWTAATCDSTNAALRSQPGEGDASSARTGESGPSGAHAALRGWERANIGLISPVYLFEHRLVKLYCFQNVHVHGSQT